MSSTLRVGHVGPEGLGPAVSPNAAAQADPPWEAVFTPLTPQDPRDVSGYPLRARIGEGGMGAVYLSHTPGGRPVALKVARAELATDPEFRRRFASEVAVAQRVQGLYTAPVIDAGPDATPPWLATAYVAAPSLASVLSRHGALPADTVLLLLAGAAEALHSIHGAGVIHRDLKPGNIILAADGPRVIDFGIARAIEVSSLALTRTGALIGTPAYMAPEQVQGKQVSTAADVFALGATAYHAVTGALPFGTDAAVFHRIVHEEPDWDRCPEKTRGVLRRCMAKDPAVRPTAETLIGLCRAASADEQPRIAEGWLPPTVTADLTRYSLTPPPPPPPAVAPAETERSRSPEPVPASPGRPGRNRKSWLVGGLSTAVLAAVLVAVLVAVLFAVLNNAPDDASDSITASTTASGAPRSGGDGSDGDGSGGDAATGAAAEDILPGDGIASVQPGAGGTTPESAAAPGDSGQADPGDTTTTVAPGQAVPGGGAASGQPGPAPTAAGTSAPPAAVPAAPPPAASSGILKNQNTRLCADDSISQGLRHNDCNGGSYQRWTFAPMGDGTYRIRNANSGLCLDDSVSQGLRDNECNGGSYQRWYFSPMGDGSYQIRNAHSGLCMGDSFSQGLRHNDCNGSTYQRWYR